MYVDCMHNCNTNAHASTWLQTLSDLESSRSSAGYGGNMEKTYGEAAVFDRCTEPSLMPGPVSGRHQNAPDQHQDRQPRRVKVGAVSQLLQCYLTADLTNQGGSRSHGHTLTSKFCCVGTQNALQGVPAACQLHASACGMSKQTVQLQCFGLQEHQSPCRLATHLALVTNERKVQWNVVEAEQACACVQQGLCI